MRNFQQNIIIGTIGEFTKNKGQEYLIEAAKKLQVSDSRFQVIIIGWGELESKLRDKIKNEKGFKEMLIRNLPKDNVGERGGNSKLSENQVLEIIQRFNNKEKVSDFVVLYPCKKSMIYEIKAKRSWKHLSHLIKDI